MATIITVHGTNDSGPPEGEHWWQKGGRFERNLRSWIEADDGELRFEPLIWDGRNSETSRFRAGAAIEAKIAELAERNEPTCFVGHSHGGSSIGHALVRASAKRRDIDVVKRWITVATPFIETRRSLFLFSRLGWAGVAAYLVVSYLAIVWGAFVVSSAWRLATSRPLANPWFDLLIIPLAGVFLLALYWMLRRIQPLKVRLQPIRAARLDPRIGGRWLSLWHADDEVIQGFKLLKEVKLKPFEPSFAAPPLATVSLLLVPIIMYALSLLGQYELLTPYLAKWGGGFTPEQSGDAFKDFARENFAIAVLPARWILDVLEQRGLGPGDDPAVNKTVLALALVAGAAIMTSAFWSLGVVLHRLVLLLAGAFGGAVSAVLNAFTNIQIRRLGWGGDATGESALSSAEGPSWLAPRFASLPAPLSAEISRLSDESAAASISRLRAALGAIAFSQSEANPQDLVSRYVTWRELVHTNYFNVDGVHKLIAYAISREDGFKPSEAFLSDPDYPVVMRWYEELTSGAGNGAVRAE